MKIITLLNEQTKNKYNVNIVFCVFDISQPMLKKDFECNADNSQQALSLYNKKQGINYKYRRADGYEDKPSICVYKVYYDINGYRYKYGKRVWFKII